MSEQKYKSSRTSINRLKVPRLFHLVSWEAGTKNLDYGGGKFDTASVYLKGSGVINNIYDPFNRSEEENLQALQGSPYDTVTLSNVLNVVAEFEVRQEILQRCWDLLRNSGQLYITVYEGKKDGVMTVFKDSCQLNKKLKDYLPEVQKVFRSAAIKNGVIICTKN